MFASRRALLACLPVLSFAACADGGRVGPSAVAGQRPDATVDLHQMQAAYIGSASGGSGTLNFRGRRHPFSIAGGGIGGIGASTIDAQGDVFNLRRIEDFAGTYAQARQGFALGNVSGGELWLQNDAGVIMHLRARRSGLMLSLGGDVVVIRMD